jgi:triosephosphate isomerase
MTATSEASPEARPAKLVVGVWKDKLTTSASLAMARELKSNLEGGLLGYVPAVAPAPIAMLTVRDELRTSPIAVAAQDVNWPAAAGSYIGTTTVEMLLDAGIGYAMIGHSERRRFFGETDESVSLKIGACLEAGIVPIVCIGDDTTDLNERRRVLTEQIERGFLAPHRAYYDLRSVIIAYEPVWAISTWRSDQPLPSGQEVADMLGLVREISEKATGESIAGTPFLFGGSVNPTTAPEYFGREEVDGALVGGASLSEPSLTSIFRAAASAWPI